MALAMAVFRTTTLLEAWRVIVRSTSLTTHGRFPLGLHLMRWWWWWWRRRRSFARQWFLISIHTLKISDWDLDPRHYRPHGDFALLVEALDVFGRFADHASGFEVDGDAGSEDVRHFMGL